MASGEWVVTNEDTTSPETVENVTQTAPSPWYIKEVPKGPWTLQLDPLKSSLNENSIRYLADINKPGNNYYRGYRLFKSEKVKSILLSNITNQSYVYIKSKIESSYRVKEMHNAVIEFDTTCGKVNKSYCNCKCGVGGKCSHIFAVLWLLLDHFNSGKKYIHIVQKSCTEKSQSWGTGSLTRPVEMKKFSDLSFVKHTPNKAAKNIEMIAARKAKRSKIRANLTPQMLEKYCESLKLSKKNLPFCQVLEKNNFKLQDISQHLSNHGNSSSSISLPEIVTDNNLNIACQVPENSLNNDEYVLDESLRNNAQTQVSGLVTQKKHKLCIPVKGLWGKQFRKVLGSKFKTFKYTKLSLARCRFIQNQSKGQGLTQTWEKYKKLVLTSTKFYNVIHRKKAVNESFIHYIFGGVGQTFDQSGYLQQGLENEKLACIKYKRIKKNHKVYKCGLCINPSVPILGTSPDRIVKTPGNELGLLEIKTLCKAINNRVPLYEAIKNKVGSNAKNLDYNGGFIYLKRNSPHFYQVQGQMALCGLEWCDYFVDAGNEFHLERIFFDKQFWRDEMLPKLVNFYYEHYPK